MRVGGRNTGIGLGALASMHTTGCCIVDSLWIAWGGGTWGHRVWPTEGMFDK